MDKLIHGTHSQKTATHIHTQAAQDSSESELIGHVLTWPKAGAGGAGNRLSTNRLSTNGLSSHPAPRQGAPFTSASRPHSSGEKCLYASVSVSAPVCMCVYTYVWT